MTISSRAGCPRARRLIIAGTSLAFAAAAAFVLLREGGDSPAGGGTGNRHVAQVATAGDNTADADSGPSTTPSVLPGSGFITPLPAGSDAATLIARAQEYVKIGLVENGRRLNEPKGMRNDLFKLVLAADPDNEEARRASARSRILRKQSQGDVRSRALRRQRDSREEGLKAQPDDASLKQLLEDSNRAAGY